MSKCMHHSLRDTTNPAEGYSDETAAANKCILHGKKKSMSTARLHSTGAASARLEPKHRQHWVIEQIRVKVTKAAFSAASPGILKAVTNQKESLAGFKEPFTNCPPFISLWRKKEISLISDTHPYQC
ncbi:hypothetical protein EK904_005601 [Melospiza melodia maxima]|nr:hypothetical protein EK904_005601 [Melospiza melodia maxima]